MARLTRYADRMAAQDGKTNPFDGSGGGAPSGWDVKRATTSRPQVRGAFPLSTVPPGGPLPFVKPTDPPGGANKLGPGTLGSKAPVVGMK